MRVQSLHPDFIMPTKGSDRAGAWDIYMPTPGHAEGRAFLFPLGFAAEVPEGHIALLMPRSGVGAKQGLELNNTVGLIDSDYRGEWLASIRTKSGLWFEWEAGERILQFTIVPFKQIEALELVTELSSTKRGAGGFGASGK